MSATQAPAACRQHLHFDALIQRVRKRFEKLPEQRRCPYFSLADTLMAGLALFSLKDPSLLAFCGRAVDHNLRSVFGLKAIPSDTQMREILDDVRPRPPPPRLQGRLSPAAARQGPGGLCLPRRLLPGGPGRRRILLLRRRSTATTA